MSQTDKRAKKRLLSIELLRMISMLGIALFHTFQPWFEALVTGSAGNLSPLNGLLMQPSVLTALGCIDQLGAWGNHVFIMISGYFLLPRIIGADTQTAQDHGQTIRRVTPILITLALYITLALLLAIPFEHLTSVSLQNLSWLAQGLQFVWVYLLLVLLCPLIGRVWRQMPHFEWLLILATLAVYGTNLYIAFVSPGSTQRSLFEWRKLASGVTYALSFVIGGWVAQRKSARHGAWWEALVFSPMGMALSIGCTVLVESYVAHTGNLNLLDALSYKSTSLFSFVMAVSALGFAVTRPQHHDQKLVRLAEVVAFFTSGMLGFYVLQALFSHGWHQLSNAILSWALALGVPAFLMAGMLFSVALYVVLSVVDALFRQPLLERLGF